MADRRQLKRCPSHSNSKTMQLKSLASRVNERERGTAGRRASKDDLCLLSLTFEDDESDSSSHIKKDKKDDEWKRKKVINELLETERKFVQNLTILDTCFRTPFLEKEILSKSAVDAIFSNIVEIRKLQSNFLDQLLFIFNESPAVSPDNPLLQCKTLAELFHRYSNFVSPFTTFCSSHSALLHQKLIHSLMQSDKKFNSFLEEQLKLPQVNKQTLQSLLTSVPQRICKYPLLLREYLKTLKEDDTQRKELQSALNNLNQLLDDIDKNTAVSSDFGAMLEIQRKLITPKNVKVVEEGRSFLFEAPFPVAKPHHTYGSYGFLFSDILMLAKPKGDLYKLTRILQLNSLILCNQIADPKEDKYELRIAEVSHGMFKVIFDSKEKREEWMKMLNKKLVPDLNLKAEVSSMAIRSRSSTSGFGTLRRTSVRADSKLLAEINRRKEAENRVKELEAEVKQLKKRVHQQNKMINELVGQSPRNKYRRSGSTLSIRKSSTTGHSPQPESIETEEGPKTPTSKSILRSVRDRLVEFSASDIISPRASLKSEESVSEVTVSDTEDSSPRVAESANTSTDTIFVSARASNSTENSNDTPKTREKKKMKRRKNKGLSMSALPNAKEKAMDNIPPLDTSTCSPDHFHTKKKKTPAHSKV